jgi:hypothetical protein
VNAVNSTPWIGDWAWSLPLIISTVVIHVCGLALISGRIVDNLDQAVHQTNFILKFMIVIGATSLMATILHGTEAAIWASAYRFLGALPDKRSAMLYSLSAMTAYGHANLFLEPHWQLMGALEAVNGMLLFGLTTAFLFAMIQRVWPLGSRAALRGRH